MSNGIPLSKPSVGVEESRAVLEVLESGFLSHGPVNKEFETNFAKMLGVEYAIAMNSCASAIQMAVESHKIKGEVIIPSFTFPATANGILKGGAKVKFSEIRQDDLMLDPEKIEVTKDTEAIMVVHFGGLCARMKEIKKVCDKHNLILLEDSAQCIGGEQEGKKAGSFGTSCFSFFSTKNMTTGEGGMLATNNKDVADNARTTIAHGVRRGEPKWNRMAETVGFNFRMSAINAAIGLEQLKKTSKNEF